MGQAAAGDLAVLSRPAAPPALSQLDGEGFPHPVRQPVGGRIVETTLLTGKYFKSQVLHDLLGEMIPLAERNDLAEFSKPVCLCMYMCTPQ